MEGRVLRSKGVLGVGSTAGGDFMEGSDTVSELKLENVGTNLFDDAGEIVPGIGG